MTTLTRARGPTVAVGSAQRVRGLIRTELRLLRRFGVLVAVAVVTVLWAAVVRWIAPDARETMVTLVLLTDVLALGFLFVPALLVLERMEGVEAAMRMTPVRTAERVGVRVGSTTVLSLFAGVIVATVGGVQHVPVTLLGVATASVLTGLIAVAAVGSASTLTAFMLRAPLVVAPLMAPALLHATGLVEVPLLYLSPLTSVVDLLRGQMSWAGLMWQLTWIAGAATVVGRVARRPLAQSNRSHSHLVGWRTGASRPDASAGVWLPHAGDYSRITTVRSFVRVDRRSLLRDGLLLLLVASIPLLAVAGRVIGTAGVTWMHARHGVDLSPYLPVVWVVLLVVHTPVILGSLAGLLVLEDRDAGLFPAIATTRASLSTLLGYRLTATAMATALGLAVGLPVARVTHPSGAAGLVSVIVAAAALSTVPAMLMAAFAVNRVQGVAVMKILGLPLYLPVASFFVTGPLHWAFAPLPSSWVMWSLWAPTPIRAAIFATVAVAFSAVAVLLLSRRFLRRAIRL